MSNEISLEKFLDVKFAALAERMDKIERTQEAITVQIAKLATRSELQKAIADNSASYKSLRAMFWSACVTFGGALAYVGNKLWEMATHKVP